MTKLEPLLEHFKHHKKQASVSAKISEAARREIVSTLNQSRMRHGIKLKDIAKESGLKISVVINRLYNNKSGVSAKASEFAAIGKAVHTLAHGKTTETVGR